VRDLQQTPKVMQEVARAFLQADKDGDWRLLFDEFLLVVPAALRAKCSTDELRDLFSVVDSDGNGSVSIDEFYVWTLSFLKTSKGSGLDDVFLRYDKRRIGALNAIEFARAAEDVGFGEYANDLFLEFDPDNNGSVHHEDVIEIIRAQGVSRTAMRMLTEIAFDANRHVVAVDTSHWRLRSESTEAVRADLLHLMIDSDPPVRVSELFAAMVGPEPRWKSPPHAHSRRLIEGAAF